MSLVSTEDRGAVRVITYSNSPLGTMTAAGSTEMFTAVAAAGEIEQCGSSSSQAACRASSSAITTLESFLMQQTQCKAYRHARHHREVSGHQVSMRSPI